MISPRYTEWKQRGFTAFELFVVATLVGIIITASFVALQKIYSNGRDAQRATQAGSLMTSFEIYYLEFGEYPDTGILKYMQPVELAIAASQLLDTGLLKTMPADPLYTGMNGYQYCVSSDQRSMALVVNVENTAGTDRCVVSRGVTENLQTVCSDFSSFDVCDTRF